MPTMDPLALLVSAVVLAAVLAVAAVNSERVRPAYVAVPGAIFLVLVGALRYADAEGAVRQIAPTVGFLVVVLLLARLADREGLFSWAAAVTAQLAGQSAGRLFVWVVVLCATVTAVLSLDATVVLLTPVVLATAARMGVPVRPHAYAAGHLANSASLLLPVSNLTNLLAFAATGLSFMHFTGLMVLPELAAVALEYLLLRLLFRADLAVPVAEPVTEVPGRPMLALIVVTLTVVGFCVASLAEVSPIWPAVVGVLVLAVRQLALRISRVTELVQAADLPFGLFVFGLAIVVFAVLDNGLHSVLARLLPEGTSLPALLAVAALAAVLANVLNNLPAILALLPVAVAGGVGPVLAVLIGVNVGPNLTYVGSLANLLWRRVLGDHAPVPYRFTIVGLVTVPLALVGATVALWAALQV
jgi:arsenical pump membrane protein